ncbi:MAG: hypothetical protein ACYCZR_03175 [Burkholderiales bacterium]
MTDENSKDVAAVGVGLHFAEAALPVTSEIQLDASKYLPEMEEFEMTEAQKVEMLEALWGIMRSFVELGFSLKNCGQLTALFNDAATSESATDRMQLSGKPGRAAAVEGPSGKAVSP